MFLKSNTKLYGYLSVATIGFGVLQGYISRHLSYKQGWELTGNNILAPQMILVFAFLLFCLMIFIFYLIMLLIKVIKIRESWHVEAIFLCLIIFVAVISVELTSPLNRPYEKGFCDRILQEIDADKIRHFVQTNWVDTEEILSYEQWPAEIKKLTPNQYVKFERDQNNFKYIRLAWGSFLGQFGLVIGPENWTISEQSNDHYSQIDKGVFFWRYEKK